MKKCPECGNPSYDGAPVCGNCGYKFPKSKPVSHREESIFQQRPRVEKQKVTKETNEKPSNEPSVIDIIKEKKLIIGAILLITFIVICGIVITGSNGNNSSSVQNGDFNSYDAGNSSFKYPQSWENVNLTDDEHEGAIFFKDENNTIIEYYNITSSANSVKEINLQRFNSAIYDGDSIEVVEPIKLDGREASNIILENANGNFTKYVSMINNGKLYVFKVTGDSFDSITSDSINNVINSTKIA